MSERPSQPGHAERPGRSGRSAQRQHEHEHEHRQGQDQEQEEQPEWTWLADLPAPPAPPPTSVTSEEGRKAWARAQSARLLEGDRGVTPARARTKSGSRAAKEGIAKRAGKATEKQLKAARSQPELARFEGVHADVSLSGDQGMNANGGSGDQGANGNRDLDGHSQERIGGEDGLPRRPIFLERRKFEIQSGEWSGAAIAMGDGR